MTRDGLEAEAATLRAKIARGYGRDQGYGNKLAAEDAEDADLARLSEVERLLSDVQGGPLIGHGKFVYPSWREALIHAHGGIERAHEQRRRTFAAAHDAGLSFTEIADVVGLSAAGVHKIVGKKSATLDSPAGFAIMEEKAHECDGSGGFGPPKDSSLLGWIACPGCARCQP